MLPKKEEIRDKVVLVGLNSPVLREDSATEESMDELSALVETAGGDVALIPASEDIIVEVDAGKKLLRAKLPEGLIDINDNN